MSGDDVRPIDPPRASGSGGPPEPRVVGVLLAAGSGRRFGASPKQLAELEGRPLVLHALSRLCCVGQLEEVLVVVGAHGEAVGGAVEAAGFEGVRVVECAEWEEGMAASLRTGVAEAERGGADAVLVHLADLPRITPQVLAGTLDHAFDREGRLLGRPVRATYARAPGHPVVLPGALFGAVAALRGDAGARGLLDDPATISFEAGHLADPTDVDTPEQLESLR